LIFMLMIFNSLIFDANCRIKLNHNAHKTALRKSVGKKSKTAARTSVHSTPEKVFQFILGFLSVFLAKQIEAFKARIAALQPTDTCSLTNFFNLYKTLKKTFESNIATMIQKAQHDFTLEFGFQAAETIADFTEQMKKASSDLDDQISDTSDMVDALQYFAIDNQDSLNCPGLSTLNPNCEIKWHRILNNDPDMDMTIDNLTSELNNWTNKLNSLKSKKDDINNQQNYVAAGDHKEFTEATYVAQQLFTNLETCFSDIMADLKKQFVDKITDKLISAAETMIADLLGVGVVKLVARGLSALVNIIKDIYSYTQSSDDDKPYYVGAIVAEVAKFVINSLKKKKLRKH